MTTYNVSVQGTFYKTFEFDGAYNLSDILIQINADKASGDLVVDESQPIAVSVVPA
jgi:hypothetical protein